LPWGGWRKPVVRGEVVKEESKSGSVTRGEKGKARRKREEERKERRKADAHVRVGKVSKCMCAHTHSDSARAHTG